MHPDHNLNIYYSQSFYYPKQQIFLFTWESKVYFFP